MTESELAAYLADNGYAEQVVRGGGAGLIARWKRFVEEVERGYRLGLEEYRHELDLRGIVALAGLDEEVRDHDRRFAALLIHKETRVWESGVTTDPFWDYGYPQNASGALLAGLHAERLA